MSRNRVRVKIEGHDELTKRVRAMGNAAPDVLQPAALAGAEVIRDEADRMAGADINDKATIKITNKRVEVAIGPRKEKWYWIFRETGAVPHEIMPRNVKALKLGDDIFAKRLTGENRHTGIVAQPFLRPAADGKVDEAVMAAFRVVSREIDKHAEKPE